MLEYLFPEKVLKLIAWRCVEYLCRTGVE